MEKGSTGQTNAPEKPYGGGSAETPDGQVGADQTTGNGTNSEAVVVGAYQGLLQALQEELKKLDERFRAGEIGQDQYTSHQKRVQNLIEQTNRSMERSLGMIRRSPNNGGSDTGIQ